MAKQQRVEKEAADGIRPDFLRKHTAQKVAKMLGHKFDHGSLMKAWKEANGEKEPPASKESSSIETEA